MPTVDIQIIQINYQGINFYRQDYFMSAQTKPLPVPSIEELLETFDLMDDWEDRYRYLIDLGGRLPPMPEACKTAETKVEGCTSQVWMVMQDSDNGKIYFLADSDAHIVRGLIAILFAIYQGQPIESAADIDIEGYFEQLGLSGHISPNRRNGFLAMVGRLKQLSSSRR
jgi:cysteine desulfuration protein SufE